MNAPSKNERWIVQRGARVLEKKLQSGETSLNDWERLVYCLWVADYMMRNAGNFAIAVAMYPKFQTDAQRFAKRLSLPTTYAAFSLSSKKLQREYFERFEVICDEIRTAHQAPHRMMAPPRRSVIRKPRQARHR